MIRDIYRVVLKLKTPSDEGRQLDFQTQKPNILEAVSAFNEKFRVWSKRIVIIDIEKKSIALLLFIEKDKKQITTRELRSFTAHLNHEFGWEKYSREKSKLFAGTSFNEVSHEEAVIILKNKVKDFIREDQDEEINKILNLIEEVATNSLANMSNIGMSYDQELNDEQAIKVLEYLLKTRNLGKNYVKKQETISQIKKMLIEWL